MILDAALGDVMQKQRDIEQCPVLRAPTPELRSSRLVLSDLTGRVLACGLGLLGIDAPDRM